MRGNNTLRLNEATMREAVQEYLDRRTRGTKQTVESVSQQGTTSTFEVRISESQDGDHAAAQD